MHGGEPALQSALQLRSAFIESYCKVKGWKEPLSMEKVLEIRQQDGWKHPIPTTTV